MDIYFDRLKKRSRALGNHYQKYVSVINRNLDGLMGRLERAGAIERVHLWANTHDYLDEMRTIKQVSTSLNKNLDDLGCYFAFQFLQLNISALDALMLEVRQSSNRMQTYKNFMLRVGHDFRSLTTAYMKMLIDLYYPANLPKNFVFMGVGTRSDQDDIDIGVVDSGPDYREHLNKAISRMSNEMLKKSITPHYHLSEHVGNVASYSASIDEYCELLDKQIQDFVIITEMLGAARILGDRNLFFDFRRQITLRYGFNPKTPKNFKFHEGYIRGIVGESRSFMFRQLLKDVLNPKDDGLRMIKTCLFAAKTTFNLRQINAWAIIDELKRLDPGRWKLYRTLEKSLTFLEIFRYLYQMLVSQDEEILLDEPMTRDNLHHIADAMGYVNIGAASPTDFLITDYYRNVELAKEAVQELLPAAVGHLENISVLNSVFTPTKNQQNQNTAEAFLRQTKFFEGTRFWDDIHNTLSANNAAHLKKLTSDFHALDEEKQNRMIKGYVDWAWNSFIVSYSILHLLYQYRNQLPDGQFYKSFNSKLFNRMLLDDTTPQRIDVVYVYYPKLIHNYFKILTEEQQKEFYKWVNSSIWDNPLYTSREKMAFLLKLHFSTSKYFKRAMDAVINSNHEYLHSINDSNYLQLINKGSLAEIELEKSTREKIKKLNFYYNFSFFRIAIEALTGGQAIYIAEQFSTFSDTYIRHLFDTCKMRIDKNRHKPIKTKDLLGVFVTGGQGQMQAFDDDLDLIIVLDSENKNMKEYCSQIVQAMHREIVKCGIIPHYRLADYTGEYICTFKQLDAILSDETEERFIDKSQLIGARMIIGSSVLQNSFEKKILLPHIYRKKKDFSKRMLNEISNKNKRFERTSTDVINIKEDPGGLRDVELFLLICRTYLKVPRSSNFRLLLRLHSIFPDNADTFLQLFRNYEFLRKVRNLNRLVVAADDNIAKGQMGNLITCLGYDSSYISEDRFFKQLLKILEAIDLSLEKLTREIILPSLNS